MTHLGSGIWSSISRSTGAIFCETRPETIIRSAWRGLGRKSSEPKRAMSYLEAEVAIISMAQQASPNITGQSDFSRLQSCSLLSTQVGVPSFEWTVSSSLELMRSSVIVVSGQWSVVSGQWSVVRKLLLATDY